MNGEALGSLNDIDPNYPTPRVHDFLSRPDNSAFLEYVFNDPFGCHVFPGDIPDYPLSSFFADMDRDIKQAKQIHLWAYIPTCRYRCHFCQYPTVILNPKAASSQQVFRDLVDYNIKEATMWLQKVPGLAQAEVGEFNIFGGTLSLLEAMREAGCNRLVFSSTGAVYGNADSNALPESYPCAPINPYGASKWMIERILADYRSAYGLGAFCLRYFNASGADAAGGIGELRDNETHLIPRAMMALQGHVGDFAVFGDDHDTPDGTAIRDYIHVTDLAAAHVLALKLLMQGHAGGAFNLGTGTGFSVRAILTAIAAETGRKVPHVVKPRRPGDPAYLVADPTAARETLKFVPAHSDLATIIRTAWAWHKKAHPLKTDEPLSPAARTTAA